MNINILGAGTWGIALASLLSRNDHNVNVWTRNSKTSDYLNQKKIYPKLFNYKIPLNVSFTSNISTIDLNYLTIIAIPSHAISEVLEQFNINNNKFLIASKGFDLETSHLPSELLTKKFNISKKNIAILSGPNHAEEIVLNKASATVIASNNNSFSKGLQQLISNKSFRVYTSKDIIGVQVGGAVKNIIAIASGLCVGLKLGDNAQAALVSRGMNEIATLSEIYNLNIKTLYGLSGLGDLVATCYSSYSRNRKLGELLAKGNTLINANKKIGMVSEGVNSCKILNNILLNKKVNMPICNEVYNILYKNHDPKISLDKLMTRKLKSEIFKK